MLNYNGIQENLEQKAIGCDNCGSKSVEIVDGTKVGDEIDEIYRCNNCGRYTRIIQTPVCGIIHKSTTHYEGDTDE
jgi:uncharacterized Zn finger protein